MYKQKTHRYWPIALSCFFVSIIGNWWVVFEVSTRLCPSCKFGQHHLRHTTSRKSCSSTIELQFQTNFLNKFWEHGIQAIPEHEHNFFKCNLAAYRHTLPNFWQTHIHSTWSNYSKKPNGPGLTIVKVVTQSVGEHDHQVSLAQRGANRGRMSIDFETPPSHWRYQPEAEIIDKYYQYIGHLISSVTWCSHFICNLVFSFPHMLQQYRW